MSVHSKIWTFTVYLFMLSVVALTLIAILAIWGVLPKETVWKAFSTGGALSLLLIALFAGLKAAEHSSQTEKISAPKQDVRGTTMKI